MSKPKLLRKDEYDALHFVRWVLFLIVAAESAGVENLSRHRLHALLFLSFASSSYYSIKPLRQRAQRTEHGPYYRSAHLALGNLTLGGLINLSAFAPHPSPKDLQFEGTFSPTVAGLRVAEHLRATFTGEKLYQFLLDICLGTMAALDVAERTLDTPSDPIIDRMLELDLSYRQALGRNELTLRVIDTVDDTPLTVRGLQSIAGYLGHRMGVNHRDVLTAYQRLLKKRAA